MRRGGAEVMLEPDVTLTDFALAALCSGLAVSLLRRAGGDRGVRRAFAALFAALALASLLAGVWHGFLSAPGSRQAPAVWTATMLALGAGASALWMIAARLASSPLWRGVLSFVALAQFVGFAAIVLFRTQSYSVVGPAMLPPVAVLILQLVAGYRRSGASRLLLAVAGLLLVVAASVLQRLQVSLPAAGLSANGLYHVLQGGAFVMVFLAIPAMRPGKGTPAEAGSGRPR
jgi:hypothetical protein